MKTLKDVLTEGLFGGSKHKAPVVLTGFKDLKRGDFVYKVYITNATEVEAGCYKVTGFDEGYTDGYKCLKIECGNYMFAVDIDAADRSVLERIPMSVYTVKANAADMQILAADLDDLKDYVLNNYNKKISNVKDCNY